MGRLLELLLVFFKIGLCSIGGGYAIIPLIQEQVVEKLGWIPPVSYTHLDVYKRQANFLAIWLPRVAGWLPPPRRACSSTRSFTS